MGIVKAPKATGQKRQTLYIKNPIAHRLAEQVGRRMGVTLSDAAIAALEESLQKRGGPFNRKKVDALCAGLSALPVVDARTADEVLGYGGFGLPR